MRAPTYLAGRGVVPVDGVDLGAAGHVHARVQRCGVGWLGRGLGCKLQQRVGMGVFCVLKTGSPPLARSLAHPSTWVAVEDAHGPGLAAVEGPPHLGEDGAQRHRPLLLPRRARGGRPGPAGGGGRAAGRVTAAGRVRVDCGLGWLSRWRGGGQSWLVYHTTLFCVMETSPTDSGTHRSSAARAWSA